MTEQKPISDLADVWEEMVRKRHQELAAEPIFRQIDAEHTERIAAAFHRTYEALAPSYDYETRTESATAWNQVPEKNRQLMMATVRTLLLRGYIRP